MKKVINSKEESIFLDSLKDIVKSARKLAYSSICFAQVQSNWLLGKRIVEQIQKGNDKAEYGKHILKIASESLTEEFGKGYSTTNLRSFRKFYLLFKDCAIGQAVPDQFEKPKGQTLSAEFDESKRQAMPAKFENSKQQTASAKLENENQQALPAILSWTHYERLMRIKEKEIRDWYMREASNQMWNYRTLIQYLNTSESPTPKSIKNRSDFSKRIVKLILISISSLTLAATRIWRDYISARMEPISGSC